MRLNLRDIIEVPGGSVPFACELSTEGLDFPSIREYLTKPYAEGRVYNEAGILHLEGLLTAELLCACDRCGEEFESVKVVHLNMSESLEGVAGLIEIGTITIQTCTLMGKVHLSVENRSIRILTLIEMQQIGMYQIDTGLLRLDFSHRTFLLLFLLCKARCHSHHQGKRHQPDKRPFTSHSLLLKFLLLTSI